MRDIANTPVAEIMSRKVQYVLADTSIGHALSIFMAHGITGAPVVDPDGRPIGVISMTDIAVARQEEEKSEDGPERSAPPPGFYATSFVEISGLGSRPGLEGCLRDPVARHMTPAIICVPSAATAAEASKKMIDHGIHRLLVVDDARLVGLLSATDILLLVAGGHG